MQTCTKRKVWLMIMMKSRDSQFGGLQDFSVSPSPLWVNLGFKLGWTGLGLGLEGLGTNGFGVGD